jgi:hypothetical protein
MTAAQLITVCVIAKISLMRRNEPASAATRRKNGAHGASRGYKSGMRKPRSGERKVFTQAH